MSSATLRTRAVTGHCCRAGIMAGLAVGVLLMASTVWAQGPMTNGENHLGAIAVPGEVDVWTFGASAGGTLFVSVTEVGGDSLFAPYVGLVDPAGTLVAHSFGAQTGQVFVYSIAGTYTVLIKSNDFGGDDTGSYVVRLVKAPGAFTVPPDDEGGPMTNGANHTGIITPGDADPWSFSANAGDRIHISLAKVEGDTGFFPSFYVFDPSGSSVGAGFYGGRSIINAAPSTGTYSLIIASDGDAGSYAVRLLKVPGPVTVPPDDQGGPLTNGANHTGAITPGDMDLWSFTATAGEHITVTVAEAAANTAFVPYIGLFGPTGTLIAQSMGHVAAGVTATATTAGTYSVMVFSNDTDGPGVGFATGDYVLRLAKAPSAFVVPSGDEGGLLTNARTYLGVLDRADLDQWSFTATAGRLVTLALAKTGGDSTFVPNLKLIGPTGTTLASTDWVFAPGAISVTIPTTGSYRVIVSSNDSSGPYAISVGIEPWPNPRRDIGVDFGPYGLWMRYDNGTGTASWRQLDARDPSVLATGDLDGDGHTDLIASFPGAGVRLWMNDTEWVQLNPLAVTEIVTGDLDGNGRDEAIMSFPGYGVYIWRNNESWVHLHGLASAGLAVGNLDNDGRDDLVVNFPEHGVWRYMNNATWSRLHGLNVTAVKTGDVDGNGRDDIVLNFPGHGLWMYLNNTTWAPLHTLNSTSITMGNLDGDPAGRKDVVVSFSGYGVWAWMNHASWSPLNAVEATPMTSGDLDGSGRDDVVLSFINRGLWIWMNHTAYVPLHQVNPEALVTGRFNNN